MTPDEFIAKWSASELKESQAAQSHFNDLCRMLGEPTPIEADPTGESYCFERGAKKDSGGDGWADVWKRGHFGWEYKGPHANLDAAFRQLRQYALALENPPLLIVCDLQRFRIRTNWTNSVSETHEIELEDLRDPATRDKLKWALSDPERLRPGETRQALTERAAQRFATLAQSLRDRGHDPQAVAHFVNRLVFCMFAEDVGLLPNNLFTRMLEQARLRPVDFPDLASDLFGAMSRGRPCRLRGGGVVRRRALRRRLGAAAGPAPRSRPCATRARWIGPRSTRRSWARCSSVDLDPGKRTQLGAHYTDRDKIMLIVEPVIVRPWLAEWQTAKNLIGAELDYAEAARKRGAPESRREETRRRDRAERLLQDFLERLRAFTVLDPACGSGNFLYLALQALKDLEHQVQLEAQALGLDRQFPTIGPANVKGIEINPLRRRAGPRLGVDRRDPVDAAQRLRGVARPDLAAAGHHRMPRRGADTDSGNEPDWPLRRRCDRQSAVSGRQASHAPRPGRGIRRRESLPTAYAGRVAGRGRTWSATGSRKRAGSSPMGKIQRGPGLVATNSISGATNRTVRALQAATDTCANL